jgi:hypothetical protein
MRGSDAVGRNRFIAPPHGVVAGLDPAINLLRKMHFANQMDPRVKPAGDGAGWRRHRVKSIEA